MEPTSGTEYLYVFKIVYFQSLWMLKNDSMNSLVISYVQRWNIKYAKIDFLKY